MNVDQYFQAIQALLAESEVILSHSMTYDKRSYSVGFVRGDIYFRDASLLHIREFVNIIEGVVERYMYVYHYQTAAADLIFRYDNTPHFPNLGGFPHHKHTEQESNVEPAAPPDLTAVLDEIRRLLPDP